MGLKKKKKSNQTQVSDNFQFDGFSHQNAVGIIKFGVPTCQPITNPKHEGYLLSLSLAKSQPNLRSPVLNTLTLIYHHMELLLLDHLVAFIHNCVQSQGDKREGSWMFVNKHSQAAITGSSMDRYNVMTSENSLNVCLFHLVHHMGKATVLPVRG